MLRPISLHSYHYASNNPINRIDPSGEIDFLTWKLAIEGGFPSHGSIWCSSGSDYQPFAHLNIYMGKTEQQQIDWNQAHAGALRALNTFVINYNNLADGNLGAVSSRIGGLYGVNLIYYPNASGLMAYIREIKVGNDILNREGTIIRRFSGDASETAVVGSFAHEYTHLVDGESSFQLRRRYCNEVGGKMWFPEREWVWYNIDKRNSNPICPDEDILGEHIADVVGYYIAFGAGYLPKEATDFITGPFKTYLKTGTLP